MIRMRKQVSIVLVALVLIAVIPLIYWDVNRHNGHIEVGAAGTNLDEQIVDLLAKRTEELSIEDEDDLFGDDDIVRILLVGLDSRAGQAEGHCDAIQMFEVNRKTQRIQITAVPRGTYAPLPRGTGKVPGDYYVSNSCALGGIEYGLDQIERIIGKEADHVVFVGFSSVLGILRYLDLPTTETLQWLRHRQGYAIGEPQRARNHSTFLKQILVKFIPEEVNNLNLPLHYVIYNMVDTDLTFAQARQLVGEVGSFDLQFNPSNISLAMRPSYDVQDIPYDPNQVDEYLDRMLSPIKRHLSDQDYSDKTKEEIQAELLATIELMKSDESFVEWAYTNAVWYQVEDHNLRNSLHLELLLNYIETLDSDEEKIIILEDYLLEMEYLEEDDWYEKGRVELAEYLDA